MSKNTPGGGPGNAFRRSAVTDVAIGKAATRATGATPSAQELPGFDVDIEGADAEEFEEFMSSDWLDVKADPTFREKLRARLWKMLRDRHRADTDEHES